MVARLDLRLTSGLVQVAPEGQSCGWCVSLPLEFPESVTLRPQVSAINYVSPWRVLDPVLTKMNEDLTILRRRAAHCRRLANLLLDQNAARELSAFAAELDAEVQRREYEAVERRDHAA